MIDWEQKQQEQEAQRRSEEMQQRYRNAFSGEEGRRVLGDILVMCHFGVPLNSVQQMHEYNIGISIARMSGVMKEVDSLLGIKED